MTQSMGEMLQMQSKIVPLYFFARHCFAQDYTALNSPAHQYIGLLWITHWIAGRLSISWWRSLRLRRSLCVPCQSHICLAWANLKKERIPLQIPNQNLKQAIGVRAPELRSWRCSSIAQSMIVKWDVILHKSCTYIYNRLYQYVDPPPPLVEFPKHPKHPLRHLLPGNLLFLASVKGQTHFVRYKLSW